MRNGPSACVAMRPGTPWRRNGSSGGPAKLVRRVERSGAALLEIAEREDAGAQPRERSLVGQHKTAYLLRRLFGGGGFDLAPIVHGAPLPVGPVLHLVSLLRLHVFPDVRWKRRAGTNGFWRQSGLSRETVVTSSPRCRRFRVAAAARDDARRRCHYDNPDDC